MLLDPPTLATEHLIIRQGGEADIPAIVAYYRLNREHLDPWEPEKPFDYYTHGFWSRRLEKNGADFEEDRALRLFLWASGFVVGAVSFADIVRGPYQGCKLGDGLAVASEGKGLMTEALECAIPYAFDALELHRITAGYMPHNRRSADVLRRLGFVVEGYARDYLKINGRWGNHILTALVNPSWPAGTD